MEQLRDQPKFRQEIAFQWWLVSRCPANREVAAHFGVREDTVEHWRSRGGWDDRRKAALSAVEERERATRPGSFRVTDFVTKEQVDRAMVGLWLEMTGVVKDGGLKCVEEPKKSAVSWRIREYLEVTKRVEAMIERDRALGLVSSEVAEMGGNFISREDLELLATLPLDALKQIRVLTQEYMSDLGQRSEVEADGAAEGRAESAAVEASQPSLPALPPVNNGASGKGEPWIDAPS